MEIRSFDENLDKTRIIALLDTVLKEINPGLTMNEDRFDAMLAVEGDQTILSRDSLVAEDDDGKIIGFSGLLKSSKHNFWRLDISMLPEYNKSNLTVKLFESILNLASKQNAPEIRFTTRNIIFIDSPIYEKFKEMGLKPVHYNWWMHLDKVDKVPLLGVPHGINLQKRKELNELTGYVAVINDSFREHFDFRPYTVEEFQIFRNAAWKDYNVEHWLATEQDKLVGILTAIINPESKHSGIIDTLGVLHSYHHRGIGRSLLSHGIQSLIEKGCTVIELSVEATNEKALKLYKKFGFYEVESRTRIFFTINL